MEGRGESEHHRHVRDRFGCSAHWGLVCEDLPNPENRVDLSPTLTDRAGLAAPRITYRIDDNTRALCEWHIDKARESLVEAGAWHTEVEFRYPPNGHFMGTARMGDDRDRSVVDRWSMAHDVPNLGIIDGSTFVTSGGVNPTSSICALALRAVEHLIAYRGDVPTPEHRRAVGFSSPASPAPTSLGPAPTGPIVQPVTLGRPPDGTATVDDAVRRRLAQIAQVLIPAGDAMPSAAEVGVSDALLDRVVTAVPSLAGALTAALDTDIAEEDIGSWLEGLSRTRPGTVRLARSGRCRRVLPGSGGSRRLGYEGQVPQPVRPDAFPEYVDEGLLDATCRTGTSSRAGSELRAHLVLVAVELVAQQVQLVGPADPGVQHQPGGTGLHITAHPGEGTLRAGVGAAGPDGHLDRPGFPAVRRRRSTHDLRLLGELLGRDGERKPAVGHPTGAARRPGRCARRG